MAANNSNKTKINENIEQEMEQKVEKPIPNRTNNTEIDRSHPMFNENEEKVVYKLKRGIKDFSSGVLQMVYEPVIVVHRESVYLGNKKAGRVIGKGKYTGKKGRLFPDEVKKIIEDFDE